MNHHCESLLQDRTTKQNANERLGRKHEVDVYRSDKGKKDWHERRKHCTTCNTKQSLVLYSLHTILDNYVNDLIPKFNLVIHTGIALSPNVCKVSLGTQFGLNYWLYASLLPVIIGFLDLANEGEGMGAEEGRGPG